MPLLGIEVALLAVSMNQAASITQSLRDLARLEAEVRKLSETAPECEKYKKKIQQIRAPLPTSILLHYDKRVARGRLGIAAVRGGVCGACYLGLPSGRVADLRRNPKELNVCDHCGAFIYLAEDKLEPSGNSPSSTPAPKAQKTKNAHAKR
jgi:predicted  nucleic acid-binding Zn-ribbon protein